MGAPGRKLHRHGARSKARSPAASVSDAGYGAPPHPVRIRAGQRFWPRSGRRRRPIVVCGIGDDGFVRARRLDGDRERVRVSAARLAARRPDGQGRYYQFIAFAPRRYQTWAVVVRVDTDETTLVLPEWHPARPVRLPSRLLPEQARRPQTWLSLRADLSVSAGGQLNPAELSVCADPGLELCDRPAWRAVS